MSGNQTLHIICPAQRTFLGIALPSITILMLGVGLFRQDFHFSLYAVVAAVFFAAALALLYRNLFYREALYVLRVGTDAPEAARICVRTSEIVGLRRLPDPIGFSAEQKWASIGLGKGLIEIETRTDTFRFGGGLGNYEIEANINRIAAFCALDRNAERQAASGAAVAQHGYPRAGRTAFRRP